MKRAHLLIALLAAAVGFTGCGPDGPEQNQNDPDNPDNGKAPKILLKETEVSISSEGESKRLRYDIENAVQGAELNVDTDAEWILDLSSSASLIKFTVEKNETGEARTADIILSYEGAEDQTVKVTQSAYVDPLKITIVSTDATSVIFNVETTDEDFTWIGQIVGKEWYEYYAEDPDGIFEADIEYYTSEATSYNVSLQEYLSKALIKGSKQNLSYKGLDPETEYVLYAYGLKDTGERTSGIYTASLTTAEPYDGPVTFEFDIKDNNAVLDVTITPSHDGVAYYYDMTTPEILREFDEDNDKAIAKWLEARVTEYIEYGDFASRQAFYEYFTYRNQRNGVFEGLVNTDYIFFAFKWNENCEIVGDISYAYHSTGDIIPSDNVITTTVTDITQSTFYVDAKTTNLDPYFLYAEPSSYLEGISTDDEYFHYFYDWMDSFYIWNYISEGDMGGTFYEMKPDTEYTLVTFGYMSGARTTAVGTQTFRTLPMCDPKDVTFDIQISNVKTTSAQVSIKPSDTGHYYYWDVYPADYTANMVKEDIKAKFAESYGGMYDFAQYLNQGESGGYLSYLTPETEYKICAIVIEYDPDEYEDYTLDFLGYVESSDTFTTPEAKMSSTTVTCGFDEFYDGDEIAKLEPQKFGGMAGKPWMYLEIEIEGNYSEYYYTIYEYAEGYDDPAQYPDPMWYDQLLSVGWCTSQRQLFAGKWDTPLLIMAMAIDDEGNYTEIYRQKFTLKKSDAASAEIFVSTYGKEPEKAKAGVNSYEKPVCKAEVIRNPRTGSNIFSEWIANEVKAAAKAKAEAEKKEAIKAEIIKRKKVQPARYIAE